MLSKCFAAGFNYLMRYTLKKLSHKNMSLFVCKTNVVTGKMEWELQEENYDYHQEIAQSSYADMLHDTERNEKYQIALEAAIAKMHSSGKKANVLDIGTGTGLLSMMAARAGADSIFACEAFKPMANCARQVIKANGFEDKIHVIPKRSTELTVGPDGDLPFKANILVTEVFDTELIGEGAYSTFSHAHKVLLEKDCIVVPSSGTMYAQIVESELVRSWNGILPLKSADDKTIVDVPPEIEACAGAAALHDLQLSQISQDDFKSIADPEPIFKFDWSGQGIISKARSMVQLVNAKCDGKAQAVFMWWDIVMDTEGKVILSCAPYWAHPSKPKSSKDIPWRDHWMQAVYYFPKDIPVKKGQEVTLISSHDEYSLWFNFSPDLNVKEKDLHRPICTCGTHTAICRTRIGQINDPIRRKKYLDVLNNLVNENSVCLCLSDSSLLGVAAAKLGAKKVYCVDSNNLSKQVITKFVTHNNVQDKVVLLDKAQFDKDPSKLIPEKVNVVMSEPYFMTSILPWENVHFWYFKEHISSVLSENCESLPQSLKIYGIAVEFSDLWKIQAPVKVCQGFEMKCFDELIKDSNGRVNRLPEAQPLWEYPSKALSNAVELFNLDMKQNIPSEPMESKGYFNIQVSGVCHGVALWVDWDLDGTPDNTITTGPIENPKLGQQIRWDIHTRQGVYFLSHPNSTVNKLSFLVKFNPENGSIKMDFEPIDEII